MKIILAFDSFKGCMSAHEACSIAAKAILEINSKTEILEMPLSDGGEGLTKCIQKIIPTSTIQLTVHGPLMNKLQTCYFSRWYYCLYGDGLGKWINTCIYKRP